MSELRSRSAYLLPFVVLALTVVVGLAGWWPSSEARPGRDRVEVALAPLEPSGPEEPGVVDANFPAAPPTADAALAERLEILGADPVGSGRFVERLLALRDGALLAEGEWAGLVDGLGLPTPVLGKVDDLAEALLAGQPVSLVGRDLSTEDRLFLGELTAHGMPPESAAWFLLAAQQEGWPTSVEQRERLRPYATLAAADTNRREHLLDAALLRSEARSILSDSEQRELLDPIDEVQAEGLISAVCRDCPAYTYGLLRPTTAWQTHSASLAAGECKVYQFAVAAGATYRFSFCDGGGSSPFDSVLTAKSQGCLSIGFNDDSCGTSAEVDATAAHAGYMYVQVRAKNSESGDYTLAFKQIETAADGDCVSCPDHDEALGIPTTDWQTVAGSIESDGCRTYKFELLLNHTYRFTTCGRLDWPGTTDFDTVITTRTNSQSCLTGPSNDDACASLGSEITMTSRFTQFVTVTVQGYNASAFGDFELAYRDVTEECPDCPNYTQGTHTPTADWTAISGQVPAGGCDLVRVYLEDGHSYRFSFCEGDGTQYSQFVPRLRLLDENCQPLSPDNSSNCGLGDGGRREIDFTNCGNRLAYLRIRDVNNTGGRYRLAMTQLCGRVSPCRACNAQAGPLTPTNGPQLEPLTMPSGGCRVVAVDLEAKKTYRFSTCQGGGSITPGQTIRLSVRQPDCGFCAGSTNMGSCGGTSPRVEFTPSVSGIHYVIVEEVGGTTAGPVMLSYSERCDNCNNPTNNTPITLTLAWGTVSGTLTVKGGCDVYEFATLPGQTYKFTTCGQDSSGSVTGGSPPANGSWYLMQVDSGGNPCGPNPLQCMDGGGCNGELCITATGTRTYLKIARRCGSGGAYTLAHRLTPMPSCREILACGGSYGDGAYFIDPDGAGSNLPVSVYCDMTTDGGGWTLVASTLNSTLNDQASAYYADLATLSPTTGHPGVWNGMRPIATGNRDIRFSCRANASTGPFHVDLAFYDIHWYEEITTGSDAAACFEETNGNGDTQPPPRRKNLLTAVELALGNQYGAGYLEGEDSCGDLGDFTVDFDNRGMDNNQSDGTDWGEDDSTRKCGTSGVSGGTWFIWVRE